jgi:hypothetical protein
MNMH